MRWSLAACCVGLLFALSGRALADSVELTNGDVLNGRVVSLDEKELKLASEIHGQLTIRRDKIAALFFGARRPAAPAPATPTARPRPSDVDPAFGSIDLPPAGKPARPGEPTIEGALRQLRIEGGLSKDDRKQLEQVLPLLQQPEVSEYFNKTVSGLLSGDLSVGDLRKQAIQVRQQVKALEKDLGPEGAAALKGYMSILDKFIEESDPMKGKKAP